MKLGDIARRIGCDVEGDPETNIQGLATVEDAGPGELTFVANPRYLRELSRTRASAVILGRGVEAAGRPVLRAADPYLAFTRALELFHRPYRPEPGIHPTAIVDPTATVGPGAAIGPWVVIGARVRIGESARIDAHVVVYPEVTIGDRFTAHAGVVVREGVRIGNDVHLRAGVVVGSEGFGYTPDDTGAIRPIPQAGTVVLEDGVEIGANSTIDRATVGATRIRRDTKIDNLVMIAHGCDVGERTFLAAQTGLAGSTRLGSGVMAGGQVGFAGHLTVGDGARFGAQSGVHRSLPGGRDYQGYPAVEVRLWRRAMVALVQLPELIRRVRRLERVRPTEGKKDE